MFRWYPFFYSIIIEAKDCLVNCTGENSLLIVLLCRDESCWELAVNTGLEIHTKENTEKKTSEQTITVYLSVLTAVLWIIIIVVVTTFLEQRIRTKKTPNHSENQCLLYSLLVGKQTSLKSNMLYTSSKQST